MKPCTYPLYAFDQDYKQCGTYEQSITFVCTKKFLKINRACSVLNSSLSSYYIAASSKASLTLQIGYNLIVDPFGVDFQVVKNWYLAWEYDNPSNTGNIAYDTSKHTMPDLADSTISGAIYGKDFNRRTDFNPANQNYAFYVRAFVSRNVLASTFNLYNKGTYNITISVSQTLLNTNLSIVQQNITIIEAIQNLTITLADLKYLQCIKNQPCYFYVKYVYNYFSF